MPDWSLFSLLCVRGELGRLTYFSWPEYIYPTFNAVEPTLPVRGEGLMLPCYSDLLTLAFGSVQIWGGLILRSYA